MMSLFDNEKKKEQKVQAIYNDVNIRLGAETDGFIHAMQTSNSSVDLLEVYLKALQEKGRKIVNIIPHSKNYGGSSGSTDCYVIIYE